MTWVNMDTDSHFILIKLQIVFEIASVSQVEHISNILRKNILL